MRIIIDYLKSTDEICVKDREKSLTKPNSHVL